MCVCFTRKFKAAEMEPPAGVKDAFRKYAEGGAYMRTEQLRRFLVEFQGETETTVSDADNLIQQIVHRRHRSNKSRSLLYLDDFFHLLFSLDLNPPIHSKVHHDMKAPLSHYYVYTGHNSYLTGNQLTSDCSEIPIINALKKGVRVIELDLWPNSSKDKVHVLHGGTATSPVEVIRCLKAIKEHAFSASPYPVVITLEDHLTPDLQAKVAQMLTNTFGEMLFCPESEYLEEFPSPEDLKYRIIISTKPPKEYLEEAKSFSDKRSISGKGKDSDEDEWGKEPSSLISDVHANNKVDGHSGSQKSDLILEDEEDDDSDHNANAAPVYKKLIAIHAGKPKGGLHEALKVEPNKVRRLSLSEQGLEKAALSHGMDVVRFTQKNILRIYPKGIRVTSSNYKPMIGWMHGAQMVAFNMQGYGRALWLMQGMFRSNGGCGYVKKPDFLIETGPNGQVFCPKEKLPVKKTLKVTVYMGEGWHLDFKQTHFDAYSPPDFYTRVGIAGVPADQVMKKTKIKEDDWTPVWEEVFVFPLTVPELAMLRVEVHEYDMSEKDDFGGQICLPVSELRQGIRAIPLCNRKGEKYNSVRLLMRFEFV